MIPNPNYKYKKYTFRKGKFHSVCLRLKYGGLGNIIVKPEVISIGKNMCYLHLI